MFATRARCTSSRSPTEDFRVTVAVDGLNAVEKALAEPPDVIVLRFAMPGMTGLDAARKLRTHPRTAHVPIICLTGDDDVKPGASEAGCDHFLVKPCLPETLAAEVRRLFAAR